MIQGGGAVRVVVGGMVGLAGSRATLSVAGRAATSVDTDRNGLPLPGTSIVEAGPFPVIRLRRGMKRTEDAVILAELRRVADLLPDAREALTIARFWRHGRVSYTLVQRRFGSWQGGLVAAGLGHLYGGRVVTLKQRVRPARRMTDGALLAEMRRLAKEIGRPGLRVTDLGRSPVLTRSIVEARFGCWDEAVRRSGLTRAVFGRRYSGTQVYENLLVVWRHHERPPTKGDMHRHPSRIGVMPYLLRFGTWAETLEAFARRAAVAPDDHAGRRAARLEWERPLLRGEAVRWPRQRGEEGRLPAAGERPYAMPPPERLVVLNAAAKLGTLGPKRVGLAHLGKPRPRDGFGRTAKTAASVSQKLRFQVLARDRYRCQACGASPALDPGCTLEIDHVQPVSKGGTTTEANLRVLCAPCNRGRGNREDGNGEATRGREAWTGLGRAG